jgi:type 1 glutamine amidotransferase
VQRISCLTLGLILSALLSATALQADPPAGQGKIRILLTVGGHDFEAQPFYAMFDAMPDVSYTKATMPKDAGLLKPGLEKEYDVVVRYDMVGGVTPEQEKALVELLQRGIGLVALHHNLGAHRQWPEYRKIIGGKWIVEPCEIDGKHYDPSLYSHGETIPVTVADKDHPITRGLKDFIIHDETYKGYYTDPGVTVLLKTDHPKNNPEMAWTHQYGKSRVFYLMLGHDHGAYDNPNYRELVHRGILWAAGRKPASKAGSP